MTEPSPDSPTVERSPIAVHWFLPTGGDSRDVVPSSPQGSRAPSHSYLAQIATACDQLGFDAVLTPCGTGCEDAWISTASLIPLTQRLRFLVAFRPGLLNPTQAAQMAATYQQMSGGRLLVNIVIGAEPSELARFGDFRPKDDRYRRAGEFLTILRGALMSESFDFEGEFYRVERATTRNSPVTPPAIFFGGASDAAEQVAARHVDTYLAWGEPPEMVAQRVERMRALAAEADRPSDRPLEFGIRFHVITRDTADEAWDEAARLLRGMDPEAVAAARADFAATASVGQQRMAELHQGTDGVPDDPRALEISPNLWAGVGLVRGGAGTVLVGSHQEVADRIEEYHRIGFREFILSGYPHLEEAWRVGDGLLPELRSRGLLGPAPDVAAEKVFTFR
ncbi:LLM class flavin-dependent oxidoreductase [Dermatobacter hominis]|uniref:LLM class flavin-dependent oxidoreductase n=1 Tax=Dermatobacter hominis TaxID=2884263 RepID=UPI001D115576|nr:LLM class flavin-dependent oxidoreductase [Dermatobacter hominis]UDY37674.1 LLM class flavin-dependent oxidoreductase [Dermatobacter hominis]